MSIRWVDHGWQPWSTPLSPGLGGNSSGTDVKPGDLFLGAQRGSSFWHSSSELV